MRINFAFFSWASRSKLLYSLCAFCLLLFFLWATGLYRFFPFFQTTTTQNAATLQEHETAQILLEAAVQLQERWELGDSEGHFRQGRFHCSQEVANNPQKVDDNYLRCNPNYLQCFFQGEAGELQPGFRVAWGKEKYLVRPLAVYPPQLPYSSQPRYYSIVSRSHTPGNSVPSYGVAMTLAVINQQTQLPGQKQLEVLLEDSCHDSYLPQRIYFYGPVRDPQLLAQQKDLTVNFSSDEELLPWAFDNFGQDIYVDKYLVTQRDILEWQIYQQEHDVKNKSSKNIVMTSQRELWPAPATELTRPQMENYCAYRGKQVMQAHIWDAATFLPFDQNDPDQWQFFRSPYPWSRSLLDPIFSVEDTDNEELKPLTVEDCQKVYVRECLNISPYRYYQGHSTSWIEMNQVLGGPLEFMRNPLHPANNVKASSFYFDRLSSWHQLGRRGQWDGEGWGENHFQWIYDGDKSAMKGKTAMPELRPDPIKGENWHMGFRCMFWGEGESGL